MSSPYPPRGKIAERGASTQRIASVLFFLCALALGTAGRATTYYVDAVHGSDQAKGTSAKSPWRSLQRAGRAPLGPGDRIALSGGQTHEGQLLFSGLKGTAGAPITISSYGIAGEAASPPATIDGRGTPAALHLIDCSYVTVANLVVSADGGGWGADSAKSAEMRCGILIEAVAPGEFAGIELRDLRVTRVSYQEPGFKRPPEDVHTANGNGHYGWGLRFIARNDRAKMSHITVRNSVIERVDHTGLKFTAPSGGIRDVEVEGVRVLNVGGPGIQVSGVADGHFSHLHVDHSGSVGDSRNWGRGSGLWTWGCRNIVIERSEFMNANGPGDSAGVHIDFGCRDVVVQYNLSAHNAGGFCEILGDNYNCAYRYNVSINDGFRVKGRDGAFQDGKIFWLSGYVGAKEKPRGPFNSYFYNNTIFVADDIEAKIAVAPTAEGVLIANNIFCIKGASRMVAGDQLRADQRGTKELQRVTFANNAFLRADNWPADAGIQDCAPLIGDPGFANPGGLRATDYVPRNFSLVKDRGIRVPALPEDSVGLRIGLDVSVDFLGHPVVGAPDLGAMELP
jgi:hypothetical protein